MSAKKGDLYGKKKYKTKKRQTYIQAYRCKYQKNQCKTNGFKRRYATIKENKNELFYVFSKGRNDQQIYDSIIRGRKRKR